RSSSRDLLASISNSAAATFSSRCSTLAVPGIGSMTGDRASSHARATWDGVAFHRAAIRPIGLSEPETRPAASGNHGINPRFSCSQYSRTFSAVGDAVTILNADNRNYGSRMLNLLDAHFG